jgi:hypothetical protein
MSRLTTSRFQVFDRILGMNQLLAWACISALRQLSNLLSSYGELRSDSLKTFRMCPRHRLRHLTPISSFPYVGPVQYKVCSTLTGAAWQCYQFWPTARFLGGKTCSQPPRCPVLSEQKQTKCSDPGRLLKISSSGSICQTESAYSYYYFWCRNVHEEQSQSAVTLRGWMVGAPESALP